MKSIEEISDIVSKLKKEEVEQFFKELLTTSEITTLSRRWRILKMLSNNCTQREVAKELQVGLCKVTRGARILKDTKSITRKIIKGE